MPKDHVTQIAGSYNIQGAPIMLFLHCIEAVQLTLSQPFQVQPDNNPSVSLPCILRHSIAPTIAVFGLLRSLNLGCFMSPRLIRPFISNETEDTVMTSCLSMFQLFPDSGMFPSAGR